MTMTQEKFERTVLKPALERREKLPGLIADAELELAEALYGADYDDRKAKAAQARVDELRDEQERLELRLRHLSRKLSNVTGTGQPVNVS